MKSIGALSASVVAIAIASVAQAQSGPADAGAVSEKTVADIVVTGSRIARQDYVAQSPIVTSTAEAIKVAGLPTVDAYLVQTPQFTPGTGGFTNVSGGGLGVGQAQLNLRGLGPVRTLVLLDGRRLEPGNAQGVIDINTLPSSAIQSVEVITGGASATYGSDAIAGVVNFKLRHRFDGIRIDVQTGISDRGDAANHQISFIAGEKFGGGKGSVMVAGEYADRAALGFRDRAFSTPTGNLAPQTPSGLVIPTATNLPQQAVVNAVFAKYGVAANAVTNRANLGINGDNSLFLSAAPATNYKNSNDSCMVNRGAAGFGYDGFCTNNLQNKLKRYAGVARAEYEMSAALTLYVQGQYARTEAGGQGSHPLVIPFGTAGISIPVSNPFIPADLKAILLSRPNPTAPFTYVKRISELGPRRFTSDTDTYQLLAGGTGKLGLGDWSYDAYFSHGHTHTVDTTVAGSVSTSAVLSLLNAPDGGASLCSGGFNIFGPVVNSAACEAYIRRTPTTITNISQDELAASLTGSLFRLPAGMVKAALSADYRHTSYGVVPDKDIQSNDIAAVVAVQPTSGRLAVREGAVEVLVPLLANLPLAEAVNVSLGYRYAHYNHSGGNSTWKANFDWRVASPLMLRGGYQKAVRAPNIGELFQPAGGTLTNVGNPPSAGDPCDISSSLRTGANGAKVRSLCLAQGMPAQIVDSYHQPGGAIATVSSGNLALTPETAKSYTFGGVFQPTFLGAAFRRLSLSADYYSIKVTDTIGTLSGGNTLNKCFNADGSNPNYDPANLYCGFISRSTINGQITNLSQPLLNLGAYRTRGLDVALDWSVPLTLGSAPGNVSLNVIGSRLLSFKIQPLPGVAFQDFTGTISTTDAYPKLKINGTLAYEVGRVQIGGRWRHLSSFRDSSLVTNPASTITAPGAYDTFDVFARLRATDRFQLRAGVTNVADRQPPRVGSVAGVTNAGVYDAIGRAYYFGVQASF